MRDDSPYHNGEIPRGPRAAAASHGPSPPAASPQGSALNRYNNPILSAPSRPRGSRGGFGSYAPPRESVQYRPSPRRDFSSGGGPPRGGGYMAGPSPRGSHFPAGNFRGNSSSTTYPRSQRFDNPTSPSAGPAAHLSDLAKPVEGGVKIPGGGGQADAKIRKLEEEAERLRNQIAEKQDKKRGNLREWSRMGAETETLRLRGELIESKVGGRTDDGVGF
jgi:hypothetical protein